MSERFEAGRELINRLHRSGFDVSAAGWLWHANDETWRLYVVTTSLDQRGLIDGYRAVYDSLVPLDTTPISIGEVKLVRQSDPIGRALRELATKFDSQPRPSWEDRYSRTSTSALTDLGFSWAMAYSPAGRMAPGQVVRVVADIITAAGSPDGSRRLPVATFEHGGRSDKLHPTAVRLDKSTKRLLVEADAADTGSTIVIPADEITDIRLQ